MASIGHMFTGLMNASASGHDEERAMVEFQDVLVRGIEMHGGFDWPISLCPRRPSPLHYGPLFRRASTQAGDAASLQGRAELTAAAAIGMTTAI